MWLIVINRLTALVLDVKILVTIPDYYAEYVCEENLGMNKLDRKDYIIF